MEKLPELWKRLKPFVVRDLQIALSPKKTTFSSETPIGIQLIFPGGDTKLYPVNEDGFRAALAASVDGCSIIIPASTITFTGQISINKKIRIIGTKNPTSSEGYGTWLKCIQDVGTYFVYLNGWVGLENLLISYEISKSTAIRAISTTLGGNPEFVNLYIIAKNNGSGDAYAIYASYAKTMQNVVAIAYTNTGYATGLYWYQFDGSAKYCKFAADSTSGSATGASLVGTSTVVFYYCEFVGKTKGLVIGSGA
jgi:hypothetical protein